MLRSPDEVIDTAFDVEVAILVVVADVTDLSKAFLVKVGLGFCCLSKVALMQKNSFE